MRCSRRTSVLILGCLVLCCEVVAQRANAPRATPEKAADASVTGRVMMGGAPVAGIVVAAYGGDSPFVYARENPAARGRTDADGRYRLTNLRVGRYTITPLAPGLILPNAEYPSFGGKALTFDAGDALENIDFTLERGGVITGRVTDAEGQPIIGQMVNTTGRLDENGKLLASERSSFNRQSVMTDDRGIYRMYGLLPGKYKVSAGMAGGEGTHVGFGTRLYVKTYYPGTTDIARATTVEVTEGAEAAGIDITLGKPVKTFTASGRVVDASTNEGFPNVSLGQSRLNEKGETSGAGFAGIATGRRGEFRVEGLEPGRYRLLVANFNRDTNAKEYYSDGAEIEIRDEDISNVEIKMKRGASLSGIVALEDATNRQAAAQLSRLNVAYYRQFMQGEGRTFSADEPSPVDARGAFRFGGIRPGRISLHIPRWGGGREALPFEILRVERGGVPLAKGEIEIREGEQINDVRVIVAYGAGRIRGTVNFANGELPANARVMLALRRTDPNAAAFLKTSQMDANRRFLIEQVPAGEYELSINASIPSATPNGAPRAIRPVRQTLYVSGTGETTINLTLDLLPPKEDAP